MIDRLGCLCLYRLGSIHVCKAWWYLSHLIESLGFESVGGATTSLMPSNGFLFGRNTLALSMLSPPMGPFNVYLVVSISSTDVVKTVVRSTALLRRGIGAEAKFQLS